MLDDYFSFILMFITLTTGSDPISTYSDNFQQ